MDEINTRIHPRHLLEKSPSEINPRMCDYFDVWDGKDVEGQPERESEPEADLASLVEIESGKMRHFSHDHDLTTLNANVEEESVRDDRPPLECLACKNKSRTVATMETTDVFWCEICEEEIQFNREAVGGTTYEVLKTGLRWNRSWQRR
ncbi:hypothetical protein AALP_AA6G161900 [Arabis alpina]|uniref:Uncharacterized protein n=1 Tax=Arabis alpina TaxID=50452 RepID=A0A087GPL0_ARAAL|nr:hypothetical protein AALP_AA6G161900 [Arabis alpina]